MEEQYLIPANVKTRFEFFEGFGWKELIITLIGAVIGTILFFIVGFFSDSPFRFLLIFIGAAGGFFLCRPDPRTGISLLGFVRDFQEFKSKPQTYYYKFGEGRSRAKKTVWKR